MLRSEIEFCRGVYSKLRSLLQDFCMAQTPDYSCTIIPS
jgi:hypothetical protein